MSEITNNTLSKPFWVIWAIEIWERFGYYATQALLALFFVKHFGYSESESMYVFGSFFAFVYGFVWVGGQIGDKVLGAKRTIVLGAIILLLSYISLFLSTQETIFYALGGIIVGNALFKANPSSLVSKLYKKGDPALDGAMTMYYMAINIGSFIALFISPIVAQAYGYKYAFLMSATGLFLGLLNFFMFYNVLSSISTEAGRKSLAHMKLAIVVIGSIASIFIIGAILPYTKICYTLVAIVATYAFSKFLGIAFSLKGSERKRMLVAFILIIQGTIFFVLYNQMPTSLTFLAQNNIHATLFGWDIPAAQYQVLNPVFILLMSPILAWGYQKMPGSHVTKFCLGMSLCAGGFLILWLPQFFTTDGYISPLWMVGSYWFQSTGELLISGLGVAMVAELCPKAVSGFVMGVWFITAMVAGPISAWVGSLTTPNESISYTPLESIHIYGTVFGSIGVIITAIALLMWASRPILVKLINHNEITHEEHKNQTAIS
jgi:proton-dependent oligopeptide transporter, POT family